MERLGFDSSIAGECPKAAAESGVDLAASTTRPVEARGRLSGPALPGGSGRGAAGRPPRDGWGVLAHGRRADALAETRGAVREAGDQGNNVAADPGETNAVAALSE